MEKIIEIHSIDSGMTPNNWPSFNIDWAITEFCNLDCSYCESHDNATQHPNFEFSARSIDFAFKYADLVMSIRSKRERNVTLNLLGGEVMVHPQIEDILRHTHNLYRDKYADKWKLSVCLLTNANIGKNVLKKCLPYIQHWTVSYHTETNKKQKKIILENIFELHRAQKLTRVRVMLHSSPKNFSECTDLIKLLKEKNIPYEVTPIGAHQTTGLKKTTHTYTKEQSQVILEYWKQPNFKLRTEEDEQFDITKSGYHCCSGQLLCTNQDRKNLVRYIPNSSFKDWYCSVHLNFLSIKQTKNLIFHNHSCRVRMDSTVGAIGTLNDVDSILKDLENHIRNKTVPIIKCPKDICGCGRCAPKADDLDTFKEIMSSHCDVSMLNFNKFQEV